MTLLAERVGSKPGISFTHFENLTGPFGLYEHALHDMPRLSHGYCTDDNSRALVVLARCGRAERYQPYLGFVLDAETSRGWRNRMTVDGEWLDLPWSDDAGGRATWGLGEVIRSGYDDARVVAAMRRSLTRRSPHTRTTAYQLLGGVAAASLVDDLDALRNLADALPRPESGTWMWPEPRLTYDNARIPEVLIRAGEALADNGMVGDGLRLLTWLADRERGETGFSFTPVGGRGPEDRGPAFDQQPIEAWAMVDACHAAWTVDGSPAWRELMVEAGEWFLGRNDVGVPLYEWESGAGFDGLQRDGVNRNRGAESTLAALGSLWRLWRVHEAGV